MKPLQRQMHIWESSSAKTISTGLCVWKIRWIILQHVLEKWVVAFVVYHGENEYGPECLTPTGSVYSGSGVFHTCKMKTDELILLTTNIHSSSTQPSRLFQAVLGITLPNCFTISSPTTSKKRLETNSENCALQKEGIWVFFSAFVWGNKIVAGLPDVQLFCTQYTVSLSRFLRLIYTP